MPRSLYLLLVAVGLGSSCSLQTRPVDKAGGTTAQKITFIEDDYPRALAEAKARKMALLVDLYAPWCWACRYMEESVFVDPALVQRSAQFVWAHSNIDRSRTRAGAGRVRGPEAAVSTPAASGAPEGDRPERGPENSPRSITDLKGFLRTPPGR
jgi:Thioredoxin-like